MVLFLDKTNRILDFLCLLMTWSTNQQTSVCKISNCRFAVYILLLAIYRNIDAIMRHTLFTTIFWYIPLLEIYRLWCEPFYCYFRLRLATCCQGCWTKMLYVSPLMSCVKVQCHLCNVFQTITLSAESQHMHVPTCIFNLPSFCFPGKEYRGGSMEWIFPFSDSWHFKGMKFRWFFSVYRVCCI